MSPEHAQSVILACCVMHNYLRTESCSSYTPPGSCDIVDPVLGEVVDGTWRAEGYGILNDIEPTTARNHPAASTETREQFTHYFSNEGALEWQERHIRRTN